MAQNTLLHVNIGLDFNNNLYENNILKNSPNRLIRIEFLFIIVMQNPTGKYIHTDQNDFV